MGKKKNKDPFAEREAQRYDNPVPSREFLLDLLQTRGTPATHPELVAELGLTTEDEVEALRRRLIAMVRDGQVICSRQGAYGLIDRMSLIRGRVQGHPDGHGLLIPDQGGEAISLSHRQMRGCFDGDRAVVRTTSRDHRGRMEGHIVEVIERNTHFVVGRYHSESGVAYVLPENRRLSHDVLIPPGKAGGAETGDIVSARITDQPDVRRQPLGEVTEVLGRAMAPGMEIDIAVRSHGIPYEWPEDVIRQLDSLPDEVQASDLKGRVDLRDRPFVTIDGEDARDFDDAICVAKRPGGWKLWVAIADVSHYVRVGSALDKEAELRATSVYFPERVIPMLPEKLSNGLCSLNPAVDRLTLVCEMLIKEDGEIEGYRFYEAVIWSQARLTYSSVWDWMQGDDAAVHNRIQGDEAKVIRSLTQAVELYEALRRARARRGAMDIETVEPRIIFGADKKIERIEPYARNDAHKIIEECMLAANTCTGEFLDRSELPALYRVHDVPSAERLENLRAYLAELGLALRGGLEPAPADYRELMEQIHDRADHDIIQSMILRSMCQAVYQPENLGHFGLAYDAYAHFTSPIRRYPDLLVHRALRGLIYSGRRISQLKRTKDTPQVKLEKSYPYSEERMIALGEHCSHCERRADDATRDVISWLKCEFMQERIGEVLSGKITAVLGFGFFVQLDDFWVDGLVHVTALARDYYVFDAAKQRLVGERTRVVHALGDAVQVRVARVSLDDRKIDFEMVDGDSNSKKRRADAEPVRAEPSKRKKKAQKPVASRKKKRAPRPF